MRRRDLMLAVGLAVLVAGCSSGQRDAPQMAGASMGGAAQAGNGDGNSTPLYGNLGPHNRPVTTASEKAQAYFDEGLLFMYAFGTSIAEESFRASQAEDPECASCYWGEAWSLAPYLNGGMSPGNERSAHAAMQKAKEHRSSATEVEQALIDAFDVRFEADPERSRRRMLDTLYAREMDKVAARYPDDLDVLTLQAEAWMLLRPRRGDVDLEAKDVKKIRPILETVLARDIRHPGACHLYIHLVEASQDPGLAEACSDHLGSQIAVSHIHHMPTHIYMNIGRWGDAVRGNQQAWHADQKAAHGGPPGVYPSHNLHMLLFAASMAGEGAVAMQASRNYGKLVSGGNFYESLTGVRFGFWEDVLAIEERPEQPLFAGFWDFGRGFAHLRMERPDSAAFYMERLKEARGALDDEAPFRGHSAVDLITVVGGILEGEMLAAEGDVDGAVRVLEEAIEVEDGLRYDEPEPLNFAARHWLGAILNDAGRHAEAEEVFRAALEDHPHNGWSLFGLERALRAQGRDAEADETLAERMEYWANADVWLMSARF